MAKIRGVKPDLWTDENFVELSPYARLLWVGLWNFACDNGHIQDKSKQIKMRILPTDEVNCAELLREIAGQQLIERVDGWITIPNLSHHQKPHKSWWTTCDKPGCELPPGASHAPSNRGATVAPPKRNRGATGVQPVDNGVATADVDCEVDGEGESDSAAGKPATSTRKKPATRIPEGWHPTEAHWARRNDGIDVSTEAEKFRLHAEANDRRQVNWNAAFSQWLLNARPAPGNVRPIRPTGERPEGIPADAIPLPPLPKRGFFDQ